MTNGKERWFGNVNGKVLMIKRDSLTVLFLMRSYGSFDGFERWFHNLHDKEMWFGVLVFANIVVYGLLGVSWLIRNTRLNKWRCERWSFSYVTEMLLNVVKRWSFWWNFWKENSCVEGREWTHGNMRGLCLARRVLKKSLNIENIRERSWSWIYAWTCSSV